MDEAILHIPEGINFECTGCGNCCFSWPVPATDDDVERINKLVPASLPLFRPLAASEQKLSAYTHTLEKRADGCCQFLTEENRCRLHLEYGSEAKPAMCQLFPYTFTPAPSGIYASVSFASTGVLYNSGMPLSQQRPLLDARWRLLSNLMPGYRPDWTTAQIADGVPLAWDDYLAVETVLLAMFAPVMPEKQNDRPLVRCWETASAAVVARLPAGYEIEKNLTDARPKVVDQILLKALLEFYFPPDVFCATAHDLPARQIAVQLVTPPNKVRIEYGGSEISVVHLLERKLGALSPACGDLIRRFVYCRLFAKLYFGPGYNNLSLIAGLHHLFILVAIIRIQLKQTQFLQKPETEQFMQLAELVRTLERRLTVASLSRESSTVLEVLLSSPQRLSRMIALAN